jgi:AAA domain, putative AbiEii toxin, Type IV TA system
MQNLVEGRQNAKGSSMLQALRMNYVGPAETLELEFGERLNVLTGDNGLGKSFVLEVAWWALTGTWVNRPMLPQRGHEAEALLAGQANAADHEDIDKFASRFDRVAQKWADRFGRDVAVSYHDVEYTNHKLPGWLISTVPVLYVRPDGMFSLWDPARVQVAERPGKFRAPLETTAIHFTPENLWNGLERDGKTICNGLIQDWVTWQLESQGDDAHPFNLLTRVLARLSHPDEPMRPGKPLKLYLDDARKFPTIELPYETIPVIHASAGMKRILGLAYIITWMWVEHVQAAQMTGRKAADRLVVLVEEPETHLHPKWQRHIVPALLDVLNGLGEGIRPQIIMTTHAPLVLASLETHVDREKDRLFNFELRDGRITLDELPWVKYGDASAWLTSEAFDLSRSTSSEAEKAINAAYDLMADKLDKLAAPLDSVDSIDAELRRVLDGSHPFLIRWRFFREQHGAS